jgi:D-alanyl-D-alanine carboxypeptidase
MRAVPFAVVLLPAGATADIAAGRCALEMQAPAGLVAALDAVLEKIVTGNEYGAAQGAVLSVAGPAWRYVRATGMADPETREPVDCAMPFQIGSNTKMMTAVVLLQLHEEGRLSLDDPLSRHLPEVAARLPHAQAITLRHLAQHTAGVFSYTDTAPDGTPGIAVAAMSDPEALRRQISPQEMIDFTVDHGAPSFAPGAAGQWAYSNSGYTLLGMVIERTLGLPLNKAFENRIFGPLGMQESYLWDDTPRHDFGLARSWLKPPFDVETSGWNMSQAWAGGGVISTPGDMHRFMSALLEGALFTSPDTLALMQQTVPSPIPGTSGYGLGLIRLNGDVWGHGGQTLGYISAVGASAGSDVTFVAWGNSAANPVVFLADDITGALRQAGLMPE